MRKEDFFLCSSSTEILGIDLTRSSLVPCGKKNAVVWLARPGPCIQPVSLSGVVSVDIIWTESWRKQWGNQGAVTISIISVDAGQAKRGDAPPSWSYMYLLPFLFLNMHSCNPQKALIMLHKADVYTYIFSNSGDLCVPSHNQTV